MKYRIAVLALFTFIGLEAQVNDKSNSKEHKEKDKIVETNTRVITVIENDKKVEKKVMVRTLKEQKVETDPQSKMEVNQPRVFPETKIEKVIYIDNDNDPFYDSKSEMVFYKQNGMEYNFKPTASGFEITNSETNKMLGKARYSNNSRVYLLDTDNYSGIGYFRNGEFIIEYYDENGILNVKRFQEMNNN